MRRGTGGMVFGLFAVALMAVCGPATAESMKSSREALLRPHLNLRVVTELEWSLVWVNLQWLQCYKTPPSYLVSDIVFYRSDRAKIWTAMIVHDTRFTGDREPFSSLREYQRKAIMQEAVDQLVGLVKPRVPEVAAHPELLEVEFWVAGGSTVLGRYSDGELSLAP